MKMLHGTKLNSILTCTCPQCQSAPVFVHANPYRFSLDEMGEMPKYCPNCGLDLDPEPMFYTGAMYVSYAFAVATVVAFFTAGNILFEKVNYDVLIAITIVFALLFAPVNFRLSRMIWMNIFIGYKPMMGKYLDGTD